MAKKHAPELDKFRQLLEMFRFERGVYMAISIVCVLILLACALKLLLEDDTPWALVLGLFAPAGGVMYATSRLLKMWNDAIRVLYPDVAPANAQGAEA